MTERAEVADAFVTASRALINLAVHSIGQAPVDVTVPQHRVLVLLAARGDQTIGEVAEGLGVNPSNATRYCDRLQKLDLITRSRSAEDRRVVQVGLSEYGKEVVRAVTEQRRREVSRVLARMDASDVSGVLASLHAFNRAADELADRDWSSGLW